VLAAVTRSPGEMVVGDVTGPGRARAGHVIVRPERVGICGSDFHLFSGDVGALSGSRDFYPRIQGHEVSAIVEDPGDSATAAANRAAIAHVFSHHFPLARAAEAFEFAMSRPPDAIKIVVTVN
jgi:threonine dehydrogenase-like Zn-dependent dehydrogenase